MDYKAMFKDYEHSVSEIAAESRRCCRFDMFGNVLEVYINKNTGNVGFEEHADRNSRVILDDSCIVILRIYHPMTKAEVRDAIDYTFYIFEEAGMKI